MKKNFFLFFLVFILAQPNYAQITKDTAVTIVIYADSIMNDVTNHPVGINLDYFMDGDR
jgi:alpha-N-arabinofuranosidase